jgi:hypothetical protein
MKKQMLAISMFAILLIFGLSLISAKTLVAGKIYNSPNFETAIAVAEANINVTCEGNVLSATSLSDGTYSVAFDSCYSNIRAFSDNVLCCHEGENITVWAEKDGISSSGTGIINNFTAVMPDLYLGVVNIALVPEFGLFIGALTIMSAVGIFFMVRKN